MHNPFARFSTLALLAVLILGLAAPAAARAEQETRIYQLQNRTAEDMAQQVRTLYQQAPVSVTARGTQLVVRGEPVLLDEIGALVGSLDVPPVQMRITVRYQQSSDSSGSGAGVSVNRNRVSAGVEQSSRSSNSSSQRHLVVQDGQSAHITSGSVRTLPFAVQGGRNPAVILEQVETRSGFVVSPQSISDQAVELNIVSFEEDPAALPGYETEALVTIRRVEPGQWVSLGGVSTSESRQQGGLVYQRNSSLAEQLAIDVKVDILP